MRDRRDRSRQAAAALREQLRHEYGGFASEEQRRLTDQIADLEAIADPKDANGQTALLAALNSLMLAQPVVAAKPPPRGSARQRKGASRRKRTSRRKAA